MAPRKTPLRASIVVRTLNESRHLPALLAAIEAQSVPPHEREVVLVDSGSTDGTLAIAEQAGWRILHIDRDEFSFGRSLNRGCAAARGNVLVFISGHCVPVNGDWLGDLIAPIEAREAEIVYGRQIGGPATKFSERQVFAKYFPEEGAFQGIEFFCNNANAAVSAEVWREHGFDEALTGLEDMEFAKRAMARGRPRPTYVPSASVHHHHAESWRQVKRRYEREAYALHHVAPELQFTLLDAVICVAVGLWTDAKALRRADLSLGTLASCLKFRLCQYYGAWRGHHIHRELSQRRKQQYFYPD